MINKNQIRTKNSIKQSLEQQECKMFREIFPLWMGGKFGVSNKAVKKGKLYRKFVRKYFMEDKEVGFIVQELPGGLWWMRLFRFQIIWFILFWVIICLNELFFHLESNLILSTVGKFGDGRFDAVYVLLFVFHIIFIL